MSLSRSFSSLLALMLFINTGMAQEANLDQRVEDFLQRNKRKWQDMNIPASDGKLLFDIIVKNGYKKGVEIGTSTGHSTVWIAWAFSKTGGKLITIELNKDRYEEAVSNLKEAGLSQYVDFRLANAHELVKELSGPFDFVFSDADKSWYTEYFKELSSKLMAGACYTAHNIRPPGRRGMAGTSEFLEYVMNQQNFDTTVDSSGGGLSISYKKD